MRCETELYDRRSILKRGAAGLALASTGSLLAACGSSSSTAGQSTAGKSASTLPPTSTGPSDAGTPVKGGILTVGMVTGGSSETLDVRKAGTNESYGRTDNLLDPLFFQVPGGVAPGLATSAEPNKDATEWTLKLRRGVTWHDGKPFTADDVVFTIKTWGTPASGYYALSKALIDLKNVRKLDGYTVRVPLLRPFAALPAVCSWFTAYVVQDGTTNFNKPVGTGPFKYESFTPGVSSTFLANPDYWRGAPHVDKLVIDTTFTDDAARVNALLSKQLDIAPGVPPQLAKAHAGSGGLVLGNAVSPTFIAVTLRVDIPPFNDPRAVQACKLLTDRTAMVTDVFDGYATPGNDCPGITLPYFASDIKPEYDPEKAKSLLKAAGRSDLTLPIYTTNQVPGLAETATLWSAQAANAGVKANVKQLSPSTYFTSANPGYTTNQRPLSTNPWTVFPPALGAFYLIALNSKAEYPETGWGLRSGQDKLIDQALGEVDPHRAKDLWHAVQEQQVGQGGYIIVANTNNVDGYTANVRGVQTNAAGTNGNYSYYKGWLTS